MKATPTQSPDIYDPRWKRIREEGTERAGLTVSEFHLDLGTWQRIEIRLPQLSPTRIVMMRFIHH